MTRQTRPYLKREVFISRLVLTVLGVSGLVIIWLILGMCGYYWLANLSWIDSLLNASMIMSGMGEIDPLTNPSAKIFASVYAILSGVVFLGGVSIIASPIVHRFLHRFHLEEE